MPAAAFEAALSSGAVMWGRQSYRLSRYDFKAASHDGFGMDWPIGYEDLAPYYDKTEEQIGVFGSHEGLENTPDGKFQPPPRPRCHELVVQKACQKLGIPCVPARLSILTRPLNGAVRAFDGFHGQHSPVLDRNALADVKPSHFLGQLPAKADIAFLAGGGQWRGVFPGSGQKSGGT